MTTTPSVAIATSRRSSRALAPAPRSVVLSWGMLALLLLAAVAGLVLGAAHETDCCASPPSGGHLLGTASDGADLLVATAQGLGTSTLIAVAATLLALLLGVAWGSLAAAMPVRGEAALLRAVDVFSAAPWTLLVVTLVVIVRAARPSLPMWVGDLLDARVLVIVCVAGIQWLTLARVVHARLAELRRRPFVEAARVLGVSRRRVLAWHIAPHTAGPLLAYGLLALPSALAAESFLSFLGFGVEQPQLSLGTLIAGGARAMSVAPLTLLLPAGTLVAATVALHVAGAHLRDALTPERR